MMHTLHGDTERILISEEDLRNRVTEMGREITRDYADAEGGIVVISVLRGAAIFMSDLVREIDLPLEMDYMAISSYGNGTTSSGVVRILKDITTDIEGKHVIIAEDIVDSGLTLLYTIKNLLAHHPASLQVAALLRKDKEGRPDIDCRYVGFEIPDEFVVGYGLDYAERYRNLPYLAVLKSEVYSTNKSH
jgi:hypoxanthine phosphoribosyltransferase